MSLTSRSASVDWSLGTLRNPRITPDTTDWGARQVVQCTIGILFTSQLELRELFLFSRISSYKLDPAFRHDSNILPTPGFHLRLRTGALMRGSRQSGRLGRKYFVLCEVPFFELPPLACSHILRHSFASTSLRQAVVSFEFLKDSYLKIKLYCPWYLSRLLERQLFIAARACRMLHLR